MNMWENNCITSLSNPSSNFDNASTFHHEINQVQAMSQNVVITVAVNFFVIEMSRSQSITQEHRQCLCIGAIIFYNAPWPSVQRKSKVVSIKQENTSNLWKKWFSPIQFFLLKIDIVYYKSVRFYQNIKRASFTKSPLISTYFFGNTHKRLLVLQLWFWSCYIQQLHLSYPLPLYLHTDNVIHVSAAIASFHSHQHKEMLR